MSVATIRNLLVIVSLVAIDCSLIQSSMGDGPYYPYFGWPTLFILAFEGSLLTANAVVIVGFMALPGRGRGRPFLVGFAIFGAIAIMAFLGLALIVSWDWFKPLIRTLNDCTLRWHQAYNLPIPYLDFFYVSELALFTALFSTPELLIALAGGSLARKYSRRHEHSRNRTPSETHTHEPAIRS